MRVLMIGDVVGKPGRKAVEALLPSLRQTLNIDLVVLNGENSAGGFGITRETVTEFLEEGVDVITSGHHIWDKKEIIPHLDDQIPLLRPLNYPPSVPGRGFLRVGNAVVLNLMGRVFTGTYDCPFRAADAFLESLGDHRPSAILVDFHAEATSEKAALAWYLDGRVAVVVGTHTHVPTADQRILPKGTAFVSDLGMVGSLHSVIGSDPKDVLVRFLTQLPHRLNVASEGPVQFNSVLVDIDESTGLARHIERVDRIVEV